MKYIYFLLNNKEIVYIGYTGNYENRILHHISRNIITFNDYKIIECNSSKKEAMEIEKLLISNVNPYFNFKHTCNYLCDKRKIINCVTNIFTTIEQHSKHFKCNYSESKKLIDQCFLGNQITNLSLFKRTLSHYESKRKKRKIKKIIATIRPYKRLCSHNQ